jgi:DNA-binding transcriptional ArsR family regulator
MALSILRRHPEGLTIRSLSEITGVHRQTVTKYVFELKGAGIIHRRRVGSATLLYLNKFFKNTEDE